MRPETQKFIIKSARPPVVEFDSEAMAVYVRYKSGKVARTVEREARSMHLAIDLDAKGDVIGIEGIGMTELVIEQLLQAARVETPRIDYSGARFVPTRSVVQSGS